MFEKEAFEYAKEKIDLATSMMNPQIESATRRGFKDGAEFGYKQGKEEACDIINELLINGYDESTREKALNFLYPDKEE